MKLANKYTILLLVAYVIMLVVIFVLPNYTAAGYNTLVNTTSQLGAQNTPNAWVMNIVFFLLGSISIILFNKTYRDNNFIKIIGSIFGLSLIGTALFSHAPINTEIPYSQFHDQLHSIFASTTGFSFVILSFVIGFVNKNNKFKLIAIMIGVLATILSILMSTKEQYTGIWQRLIFIICFGWIIFETNREYLSNLLITKNDKF